MSKYLFLYSNHADFEANAPEIMPNVSYDNEHMHYNYENNLYSIQITKMRGENGWMSWDAYTDVLGSTNLKELFNSGNETEINKVITKFNNKYGNEYFTLTYHPNSSSSQKWGISGYYDDYGDYIGFGWDTADYKTICQFSISQSYNDNKLPFIKNFIDNENYNTEYLSF